MRKRCGRTRLSSLHLQYHGPAMKDFELLFARAMRRASNAVARHGAGRALGRENRFLSHEDLFDFTQRFRYANVSIPAMQIREEFVRLLDLVAAEEPRTIVEIGAARGGTLFMFAKVATDDALIVGIDWSEDGVHSFFGDRHSYRRGGLYKRFAGSRRRVAFMFANSHESATLERLKDTLTGRPIDLLFIDGDHTAEGVRADYDMYSPLVREHGLIAFHDIVPGPEEHVGGVPDVWKSLKDDSALEFVYNWNQGGYGIGVLRHRRLGAISESTASSRTVSPSGTPRVGLSTAPRIGKGVELSPISCGETSDGARQASWVTTSW